MITERSKTTWYPILPKSVLSTNRTWKSCSCFSNLSNAKYFPCEVISIKLISCSAPKVLKRKLSYLQHLKRPTVTSLPHVIQGSLIWLSDWSVHFCLRWCRMQEVSTKWRGRSSSQSPTDRHGMDLGTQVLYLNKMQKPLFEPIKKLTSHWSVLLISF